MEDNDRLIEQFLKQSRQEIADNGFTERVMRGLPEIQTQREWLPVVWNGVMITVAIVLFVLLGGVSLVENALYHYLDGALTQGIDIRLIGAMIVAFVFFICHRALRMA